MGAVDDPGVRAFWAVPTYRRFGLPGGLSLSGGVVWRPGGGDGDNQGIDRDIGGGVAVGSMIALRAMVAIGSG